MTDITELAQSLKAAAENAGADYSQAKKISGEFYVIRKGSYSSKCGYCTYQPISEIDHKSTRDYVAIASPANILALVEALEKAQQRIDELDNDEVRQRLANAEHQLYMAELAKNNLRASRKAQFRKRKAAEQRIAELESRTVTVKLPDYRNTYKSPLADEVEHQVRLALELFSSAAGIKWEAE
ncbi:TPA: ead/Ea22-like family protein [Klebsiella pneumoniae]|nr:ead/Ea22-like family protein [Klebsiella pneumoniae]HBQ5693365.1 ead/Ea22-like family protein [Klebsiella pneumoniae subsp. pneumoniae]SXH45316.1 Ead domain protein [Klebsiella pneumoniae]SXI05584.1 Ead domain protein [Klebsiella pneumoniae]HBQ5699071.1 ead/Ea22-like family protein [Klebsiella pneumoniae subsp. pneumoniae]HBQ5750601.1 ead/Ea22-like family protein [Klebsiella pneumoniae subsp. pneumoniae]